MRACFQTPGQNVLQHGHAVHAAFRPLHAFLNGRALPEGFRAPAWLRPDDPAWSSRCPDLESLVPYHLYHDCGKPHCRTVDEQGRQHFPDHAAVSERTWLAHGGDPTTARFIRMDMDAHLLGADGTTAFADRPEAPVLLLTALAELHANAAMFGGLTSDGFKIKFKRLEQRGKAILQRWRTTDALMALPPIAAVPADASPRDDGAGPTPCADLLTN